MLSVFCNATLTEIAQIWSPPQRLLDEAEEGQTVLGVPGVDLTYEERLRLHETPSVSIPEPETDLGEPHVTDKSLVIPPAKRLKLVLDEDEEDQGGGTPRKRVMQQLGEKSVPVQEVLEGGSGTGAVFKKRKFAAASTQRKR